MSRQDLPGQAKVCAVNNSTIVSPHHFRHLTDTADDACEIWTLASLMLPKVTGSQMHKNPNAFNIYQLIHIEGHIDVASQYQITFKLTRETTEALIDYHKNIYLKNAPHSVYSWPKKAAQLEDLRSLFKDAVQRYTFRTEILAREGLEELYAGELLGEGPRRVKREILAMFEPPAPPFTDIVNSISPRSFIDVTSIERKWLGFELKPPPFLRSDN